MATTFTMAGMATIKIIVIQILTLMVVEVVVQVAL